MAVDDLEYNLEIVDTAGQEEFASFRDSSLDYGVRANLAWMDCACYR